MEGRLGTPGKLRGAGLWRCGRDPAHALTRGSLGVWKLPSGSVLSDPASFRHGVRQRGSRSRGDGGQAPPQVAAVFGASRIQRHLRGVYSEDRPTVV